MIKIMFKKTYEDLLDNLTSVHFESDLKSRKIKELQFEIDLKEQNLVLKDKQNEINMSIFKLENNLKKENETINKNKTQVENDLKIIELKKENKYLKQQNTRLKNELDKETKRKIDSLFKN